MPRGLIGRGRFIGPFIHGPARKEVRSRGRRRPVAPKKSFSKRLPSAPGFSHSVPAYLWVAVIGPLPNCPPPAMARIFFVALSHIRSQAIKESRFQSGAARLSYVHHECVRNPSLLKFHN